MANTLLINKLTGGYFQFVLNGDTENAVRGIKNDLLAVGEQLHFKTGNGANIIKEQFIYPADLTIVASGTFTFTNVDQVWTKLIEIGYFDWINSGGSGTGATRFDDLLDTFKYTGKDGQVVIVNESQQKLQTVELYNYRTFTDLEDTPDLLLANKMVATNEAGTALIFKNLPEDPVNYLNSIGFFDYNDLDTQTTPISVTANTDTKLTNDTLGAYTNINYPPYGVSSLWDATTNRFNFTQLSIGDTIDVRVHLQVTTTTSNQTYKIGAKFGIGSASAFDNIIFTDQAKTAGVHEVSFVAPFYIGEANILNNPAELYINSDASASVKVDGWYIRVLRRNINIVNVETGVDDATTTVKGILRLAGDLSGTATNPTVPALADKALKTTTITINGTTFDLSADRTYTIPTHDAVTLGTANGLSLSGQVLSLGLASPTSRGALTEFDYNYFFDKVQGDGNQNFIPKYILSGSGKQIGNSQIFDNGTNVGIGTTSPSEILESVKSQNSDTAIKVTNVNAGGAATAQFFASNGTQTTQFFQLGTSYGTSGVLTANRGGIYNTSSAGIGILAAGTEGIIAFATGGTTERMRITSGGNVGIGTTSPAEILHLQSSQPVIRYTKTGVLNWKVGVISGNTFTINNDASGGDAFNITSSGNVGIGTTSPTSRLTVNVVTGEMEGLNLRDASIATAAFVYSSVTGENRIGGIASYAFPTFYSGGAERIRITSGGNVGIGTTSPSEKFQVGNSFKVTNDGVVVWGQTNSNGLLSWDTNLAIIGGLANTGVKFIANNAEAMRITSGGNVGIGTTSPSQKLDVNGLINSTNGISVGGDGVSKVWTGTQAAYDAIGTKSSTTIYFIQ